MSKYSALKSIVACLVLGLVAGCASGRVRENCQEHNWQKRGGDLAQQGKMINEDFFTKKCESAQGFVDYAALDRGFKAVRDDVCDPKKAHALGKEGQNFSFPICRDHNYSKMEKAYESGLASFCSPENGMTVGLSGNPYQGHCPPTSEAGFLTSYNQGRKTYLSRQLKIKKDLLTDQTERLAQKQSHKQHLLNQMKFRKRPELKSELESINWDISHISSEKNKTEFEVQKISEELSKL
ncbi:MAG: DUF2799 domain-containing protein [Pseudobdellovibrionaceae bacterium]|nr:DUF2799 domain-containing protein [Bdellovibrionales bacterium]USN48396.1 MAG: DUF2799 domain-containing protein [Pseudobdellovibrionaceae bacterium]